MTEKMLEKNNVIIRNGKGTMLIILINLLVFIALNLMPDMDKNLLLNPEFSVILEKPWTLITVFFSHQILLHFMLNMVLLFIFGLELEKITNSKNVISLYLLAGIIGSSAIVPVSILTGSDDLIAGASAAVFALVAAFAVLRPDAAILKSKAKLWAVALFVFNIITFIINPEMSAGAVGHIAGILVGVIAGYFIKTYRFKRI